MLSNKPKFDDPWERQISDCKCFIDALSHILWNLQKKDSYEVIHCDWSRWKLPASQVLHFDAPSVGHSAPGSTGLRKNPLAKAKATRIRKNLTLAEATRIRKNLTLAKATRMRKNPKTRGHQEYRTVVALSGEVVSYYFRWWGVFGGWCNLIIRIDGPVANNYNFGCKHIKLWIDSCFQEDYYYKLKTENGYKYPA